MELGHVNAKDSALGRPCLELTFSRDRRPLIRESPRDGLASEDFRETLIPALGSIYEHPSSTTFPSFALSRDLFTFVRFRLSELLESETQMHSESILRLRVRAPSFTELSRLFATLRHRSSSGSRRKHTSH